MIKPLKLRFFSDDEISWCVAIFLPSEIVLTLYGKEGKKSQVNNYHERMNMPVFLCEIEKYKKATVFIYAKKISNHQCVKSYNCIVKP